MSGSAAPAYHYVAYIDEFGDANIERVRPLDEPGSSEWLVMGATLIEASNEAERHQWVQGILTNARSRQPSLHYRNLKDWQKPLVCQGVAKLPINLFAVTSNKKNMRQYKNDRAAARGSPLAAKQVFYNWCTRVLLERVTDCVLRHSLQTYGSPRLVKIIFSRRKGHSYGHSFAYQETLKAQSRAGTTYLDKRTVQWQVMDYRLLEAAPHEFNPGLQLADVVAAAFFQAFDTLPPTIFEPNNARLLKPRVATENGSAEGYGLTFLPWKYHEAELTPEQIDIFEYYGFYRFDFHKQ